MPRNLNSTVTVLFMMVSRGRVGGGGGSPEVHDHLHCFERVKFQVFKTAPDSLPVALPDSLPVALLSSDACELAPLRIVLLCVFLPIFLFFFTSLLIRVCLQ